MRGKQYGQHQKVVACRSFRSKTGIPWGLPMTIMSSARGLCSRFVRAGADVRKALVIAGASALVALVAAPSDSHAQGVVWNGDNTLSFTAPSAQRTLSAPRKLGAALPPSHRPRAKKRSRTVHRAALAPEPKAAAPAGSLSGGGSIRWAANSGCLASSLRTVIAHVAANFGAVTVNSTCRSPRHNRRVGGARKSYHLTGSAADFRVRGNVRGAMAYLRGAVGGLKHYGGGLFHIDTGPRRRM